MGSPGAFIHSGTLGGRFSDLESVALALPAMVEASAAPPMTAPRRKKPRRDVALESSAELVTRRSLFWHHAFPDWTGATFCCWRPTLSIERVGRRHRGKDQRDALELAADDTRQTVSPTSSAISNAPVRSTARPTGRPRARLS